jgi:beta-amylase
MMPLNTVNNDGSLNNPSQIQSWLSQLKSANVDGIMTDVWWGVVERNGPKNYDWSAYTQLAQLVQQSGLKLHVVMSFHQCGGNVGDTCDIQLPQFVRDVGNSNPDIWYTDQHQNRDQEYLSLGVDNQALFQGRSALQLYSDFMTSFAQTFSQYLGQVITDVEVGLGPAGEMRYPSYQLNRWSFPGVGAFQCYDKYMLGMLKNAACSAGHCEWGTAGPNNAGDYNSQPSQTGFFVDGGNNNYASPYGQFFLNWYSQALITHGAFILSEAQNIFGGFSGLKIAAKVAGIHWWYKTNSHAAELTAGYYNTNTRDGYQAIAQMFKKYNAMFDFTCLEMRDSEQPSYAQCGPEELVTQTAKAAFSNGVKYCGENALQRYDTTAYSEILHQATSNGGVISSFTYLRLTSDLLSGSNWNNFENFVNQMHNV